MTLYQKYRPRTFDQVMGNKALVQSLATLTNKEDPPHSFLFTGPTGCGKTTLARIVASELGVYDPDLPLSKNHDYQELNAANFRGIDTARDIIDKMTYFGFGERRVWLLDECHQLTRDAQPALLKALEEPPSHVFFLLCTTDPEKLLDTIRNRCVECNVRRLRDKTTMKLLRRIVKKEEMDVPLEVLKKIVRESQGSPRDSLTMLEQTSGLNEEEMGEFLSKFQTFESTVLDLCRSLIERREWKKMGKILQGLKDEDPEKVRRAVLGYFTTALLSKDDPYFSLVLDEFGENFFDSGRSGLVNACYRCVGMKDPEGDVPF